MRHPPERGNPAGWSCRERQIANRPQFRLAPTGKRKRSRPRKDRAEAPRMHREVRAMRPGPSARGLVPDVIGRPELGDVPPARSWSIQDPLDRGDPGGAATTALNPHRRLAKKPQCVGGVVTG
jgi:hypothetical protein